MENHVLPGVCKMATVKSVDGYTCPKCNATLKTSKKGWVYCPNKNWSDPNAGCQYKGHSGGGATVKATTTAIKPLATPSDEQKTIFAAGANMIRSMVASFLIIIARAGTGKTTCLVQLARIWQEQGQCGLFLCFAKRDKVAMQARIPECAGKVMTSNGAGLSILSDWARQLKRGRINLEDNVCSSILRQRLRDDGLIPKNPDEKWKIPSSTYGAILAAVNHVRTVKLFYAPTVPSDADFTEVMERFGTDYAETELPTICHYATYLFRQVANLDNAVTYGVDFTGQTFLPIYHGLRPNTLYSRVAVDEAQDQNPYNRALAFAFLSPTGAMVAVGDENQALYEWRGADSDGVEEIRQKMLTLGPVQSLPLTICRRCCKVVTRRAQSLVPDIQALPDAPEGTERHLETVEQLLAELEQKRTGLVICRMNAPLISLCLQLLARGIPAVLAKSNIIGQLLTLIDTLSEYQGSMGVGELNSKGKAWLDEQLAKCAKSKNKEAKAQIAKDKYACLSALSEGDEVQTAADLKRLIISLFPQAGQTPDASKLVVCSTVHGAKGGEAARVYIYSPVSDKGSVFDAVWGSVADRNNTLYVATTRCETELVFVGPMPTYGDMPTPLATPSTPVQAVVVASSPEVAPPARKTRAKGKREYTPTDSPAALDLFRQFQSSQETGDFDAMLAAVDAYYKLTGKHCL